MLQALYHGKAKLRSFRPRFANMYAFLSSKQPIVIKEDDIEEKFCRGSGPGGQKINKSMNKVQLFHIPTGATVSCQEARDLTSNRKIARKLLRDKVDLLINGESGKMAKRQEKIRKRKRNAARYY
jgi:protein subunit release factor B